MQCYDCGTIITPGEAIRKRVKIGESRGVFGGNWRNYYAEEVFCGEYASRRNVRTGIGLALIVIAWFLAYVWLFM